MLKVGVAVICNSENKKTERLRLLCIWILIPCSLMKDHVETRDTKCLVAELTVIHAIPTMAAMATKVGLGD